MPIGVPAVSSGGRAQEFLDGLDGDQAWDQASFDTGSDVDHAAPVAGQQQPPPEPAPAPQPQQQQRPAEPVAAFGGNLAAQAQAQQQAAAQQPSILDYMVNELGLQGLAGAESPEVAVAQLAQAFMQARQQTEQAQQQLQQYAYQLNQLQQAQRAAPAAALAPAQQAEPTWKKPPEWDPAWMHQLTTDANGNIVAKPGARPDLPQKYQEYQDYQRGLLHDISTKGPELFWEGGLQQKVAQREAAFEQRVQQMIEERFVNDRAAQLGRQIAAEDGAWLYQTDPATGQPMLGPTGPQFSPLGGQFMQKVSDLIMHGYAPEQARAMARGMVTGLGGTLAEQSLAEYRAHFGELPAPGAQRPAQQPQQTPQQLFRQRATRQPSRAAPAAPAALPPREETGETGQERLARMLEMNLQRDGVRVA
jgi:hypothetical protein